MSQVSLIAAIDEAGGLGFQNKLLAYLPADLQHFKRITMGKPVIMGRTTYESIGKPLPGRLNIVLSKTLQNQIGIRIASSMDEALNEAIDAAEIMIIGGAKIYSQTIDLASQLYITRIHHQFSSDVYFPKIDRTIWDCKEEEFRHHDEKNRYDMSFCRFERIN